MKFVCVADVVESRDRGDVDAMAADMAIMNFAMIPPPSQVMVSRKRMDLERGLILYLRDDPDMPPGSPSTEVQVGVKCIRESAPQFGQWHVTVGGNFGGWMTEKDIREEFWLCP